MGRSQQGNNNAYCQDSPLSWVDWSLVETNADLLQFTQTLIQLRHDHQVFRRRDWFQGREIHGSGVEDIGWFNPDGSEMDDSQWSDCSLKSISIFLNGRELNRPGLKGERIVDDSFLILFNDYHEPVDFEIPYPLRAMLWSIVIDTQKSAFVKTGPTYTGTGNISLVERSVIVLQHSHS